MDADEPSDAVGFGLYHFPTALQGRSFGFREGMLASASEGVRVPYYVDEGSFPVMGAVVVENGR